MVHARSTDRPARFLALGSPSFAVLFLLAAGGTLALARADDVAPPVAVPPVAPALPGGLALPVDRVGVPAVPARGFDTPEAAAKALFDALEANDDAALRTIAGPGDNDLVQNGTDPIVRAERAELVRAAKEKLSLEKQADGHVLIVIGRTAYPLAIPLVLLDGTWRLDAGAGHQELLARRIGEHELEAVGICLAFADAQVEYASKDRNGDGVKEYAQQLVSSAGKKDGLYWESSPGEERSPAGPSLTPFRESLPNVESAQPPVGGYLWRILTAQGEKAPGGAYSYVINGRMIAGFAMLAVPAVHRGTGVMSFLVSNQGKVYEKDLGADTLTVAAKLEAFDPDESWHEVDEATLRVAAAASPDDASFAEQAIAPPDATRDVLPATNAASPAPVAPAPVPCPQK